MSIMESNQIIRGSHWLVIIAVECNNSFSFKSNCNLLLNLKRLRLKTYKKFPLTKHPLTKRPHTKSPLTKRPYTKRPQHKTSHHKTSSKKSPRTWCPPMSLQVGSKVNMMVMDGLGWITPSYTPISPFLLADSSLQLPRRESSTVLQRGAHRPINVHGPPCSSQAHPSGPSRPRALLENRLKKCENV